jgi:hypothetical protein
MSIVFGIAIAVGLLTLETEGNLEHETLLFDDGVASESYVWGYQFGRRHRRSSQALVECCPVDYLLALLCDCQFVLKLSRERQNTAQARLSEHRKGRTERIGYKLSAKSTRGGAANFSISCSGVSNRADAVSQGSLGPGVNSKSVDLQALNGDFHFGSLTADAELQ